MQNKFELLDTIGLKDVNRSLKIIYKMLERGDEITPIIRMMTRHMKILLKVKELENSHNHNEIAKNIGIKPFFINNYIKQSKMFSVPEIESNLDLISSMVVKSVVIFVLDEVKYVGVGAGEFIFHLLAE